MIFKVTLGATPTFCGLRSPVHETCGAHGGQPGGDLRACDAGRVHCERTVLRHEIHHSRDAGDELHHEMLHRLPPTGVVHGRDVGMVDSGESGGLTPEAPDDALPFVVEVVEFRTNEIEGDQTPQMQVGALPYLAHRSVADRHAHRATIGDALSPSHTGASPRYVRNRPVPDHHGACMVADDPRSAREDLGADE
ncbi:hypothetical protein ACH4TU_17230 [Streptomyces physcomitrii]|uniref:hypothetical protein n=1 Tax=Streptomyces physcomitrii TaxID=2724184 RepID=UPI0011AB3FBB